MTCDPIRVRTTAPARRVRTTGEAPKVRTTGPAHRVRTCQPSTVDTSITYLALDDDILTLDGAWLHFT